MHAGHINMCQRQQCSDLARKPTDVTYHLAFQELRTVNELTRAANLAWKIGAAEAAGARRPLIDNAQLLLGLLSLGKALAAAEDLDDAERRELADECVTIEGVFTQLGLQAVSVRRGLRQRVGVGSHRTAPGASISRTDACKAAFARAAALSGGAPTSCLHLLVALFERPDPHLDLMLRDAAIRPDDVAREALLRLLLRGAVRTARARDAVELTIDAGAESVLRGRAAESRDLEPALRQAVSQLVEQPLAELSRTGKIGKHRRWRVAEDQGGVYVIPAD